ncbi:bifunctional Exoribonuclease [Babesia duncani]|uniref:Ribosomal RNA-processing protein 42 n=1 Tax=Babesia duncani TaxID=323732 RepID=A0AAD9PLM2_9APIC|nr:bifunctional Exoribonuclease [Babesia duncani]
MDFQKNGIALGYRLDGRRLDDHPALVIVPNVSENSHGSCQVYLDDCIILTTANLAIVPPNERSPDEGIIDITIDSPGCVENVEEIKEKDILIETLLENWQFQNFKLDKTQLCILKSEFVWHIKLHTTVLQRGGSLLDAASIGILSTLRSLTVPAVEVMIKDDMESAVYSSNLKVMLSTGYNLHLNAIFRELPICATVGRIGTRHVWGITKEEEACADGYESHGFLFSLDINY